MVSAGNKLVRIENTSDLELAIQRLEEKKVLQESELKGQFHTVAEKLRPGNILKNTIADVRASSPLKSNLLKLALGLGVGYFSRRLILKESTGIVKKVFDTALQFGVTHFLRRKRHAKPEEDDNTNSRTSIQKMSSPEEA